MRPFNYSLIKDQKWDSDMLGYIAAIYREAGKQEQYLKQRPEELEKLVELLDRKKIHPSQIITHRFPLEETAQAFEVFATGKTGKVCINHEMRRETEQEQESGR